MQENFRSFLQKLEEPSCAASSGKELLETEVLEIMEEGRLLDNTQIYEMPMEKLLDLFYDAYLWKANSILSKATIETFLKRLKQILV